MSTSVNDYAEAIGRHHKVMRDWANSIYQTWITEAVLTAAIQMPWPHDLVFLVGYNPQLLLEYKPITPQPWEMFDKETLDSLMGISYDDMVKMMFPKEIGDEMIDFEPRTRTETVIVAGSDGVVVDIESHEVEINRKLAPFITPVGRIVYAAIGPSRHGKTVQAINDMAAVLPRWGESDADPLRDIAEMRQRMMDLTKWPSAHGKTSADHPAVTFFLEGDYSRLEMHALLAMLEHESRPVILDLSSRGGSLPGMNDLIDSMRKKEAKIAAPLRRQPEYLKHDPTKSHRRRKRK